MAEAKRTTRSTTARSTKVAAEKVAETVTDAAETATAAATDVANEMMEMFQMPAKTFEAFQFQPTEFPPMYREWAEKSVSQVREAYDRVKTSAEEASDVMEDTFETTRKGMVDFNMKTLEATKANADATFDFFKKALSAKSLAEAIELQSTFARECFDTMTAQSKDMQAFTQSFAEDVSKPVKDSMTKAMETFKAA